MRELSEQEIVRRDKLSEIEKSYVQRWIPIVAATQMTKGVVEEQEFLAKWINVVDFE